MAEFWTIIERNTAFRVPKYLKNILMLNGYDDALSIESITTKDIDLFEEFGKNEVDIFIGVNDDPKDFYHIFCDKKDKFQIMRGDRVKLMDVVEFVRKKLASEAGHNFFKQAEKIIQQTSGKSVNSQNYKQNNENHRMDIRDNITTTNQFLKPSSNVEALGENKREIEMVTKELLITKHEHLNTADADLSQALSTSSTHDSLTMLLSPPPNAQLSNLTHITNSTSAECTSNIDVNAISLSSVYVGQDPDVDGESESNIQKDVSSSVSVQLQNISFGKNQHTNIGKNYACAVCEKVFGQLSDLKRHQILHSGQKDYACGVCQKTFGRRGNLKTHQIIHSAQKDYVCDVCQKTFGTSAYLKRHQIVHSGERPYVCDVCERAFNQSSNLMTHKRIHTGQKRHVCVVCEKAFGQRTDLKKHQRIHFGQKPYVCDVCQKAFSQHGNLKKHQRIHSGQKDYACDVCQKVFVERGNLKRHQRIHSVQKDCVCGVCQRAFKDASNLKRHQTIHSGKAPCGGDVCQKGFSQLSTSRHHRIHNDDKEQFACAHCGKSYKRKFNLKTHLVECFKKHNFQDRFENHKQNFSKNKIS